MHDDSPYGQYGKQNVVAELAKHNLELVQDESFKVGDADLSAQLRRIGKVVYVYKEDENRSAISRTKIVAK